MRIAGVDADAWNLKLRQADVERVHGEGGSVTGLSDGIGGQIVVVTEGVGDRSTGWPLTCCK